MAGQKSRWWALSLIALTQFMVIMDTSIIGGALPHMQADLGFSQAELSWVFNAYVVTFGGLLLLGGRLSDLLEARRVFTAGWAVPLVGSVVSVIAGTVWVELAGRAVQGVGAHRAAAWLWGGGVVSCPAHRRRQARSPRWE